MIKQKQQYLIVSCYICSRLLIAKAEQKTKYCNYCSSKLFLHRAKVVTRANSAREASMKLRLLKEKLNH